MKSSFLLLFLSTSLALGQTTFRINLAEDEATHSGYNGGWNSGGNAGSGFGAWLFQTQTKEGGASHAGFFIAKPEEARGLDFAAPQGKAFGMFANGEGFEVACAFRALKAPMEIGDSFSLILEGADFNQKSEQDDPQPGAIGFALRTGSGVSSWEDFKKGARFQFGAFQGYETYQILDGDKKRDSGIPISPDGVAVTVTLLSYSEYDLEVTDLKTKETKQFIRRRLAGDARAKIESFALFNQDGESGDAFFNGFQVNRPVEEMPR